MVRRRKKPTPLPAELDVRQLPRIKTVTRNGRTYYYFSIRKKGEKLKLVRLPDPTSPDFQSVYSLVHASLRGSVIDPFDRPGKLLLPKTDPAYQAYLHHVRHLKARGIIAQLPPEARLANRKRTAAAKTIYFIGGDTGLIKIGSSVDVDHRLVVLQSGSPIPLRILATADGGRVGERRYHGQFRMHRQHGEWFDRHPAILTEIDRLNATNPRVPMRRRGPGRPKSVVPIEQRQAA